MEFFMDYLKNGYPTLLLLAGIIVVTLLNRGVRIEKIRLIHTMTAFTFFLSILEYSEKWIDAKQIDYRLLYYKAMLIYWLYPALTLVLVFLFIRLRYGKVLFPYLLRDDGTEIVVMDEALTSETCVQLSEQVGVTLSEHGYSKGLVTKSALLIERDSGVIFDMTDPDLRIDGLSSFILSGLMEAHSEKAYLTTTGYNRNIMRFYKD